MPVTGSWADLVEVSRLAEAAMLVEIEAVAVV